MKKEKFRVVPASYLVLIKKQKILLLKRFNTGYEDGKYSFVAGHLDGNETFTQAIVREAREEAGLELKEGNLSVVHVMHRKCPEEERIDVFIKAGEWSGKPKNLEPHKCSEIKWFELNNLPKNTIPYIRQAIDCIQKKQFYSEFGWKKQELKSTLNRKNTKACEKTK